ncbi:hypothetical protein [Halorubrum sp. Ib24]|uniref:hypothetical protein n=1 Tax=Halorubrum sp. Ib24 TaxID=1383850 RepID=UPI00117AB5F3|nr:hypothetical protein [Halorubrum sp. Ib24]
MHPPETTELHFQVLAEQDRILEELVKQNPIAENKRQLLRLIIAEHMNRAGSTFRLSPPSLNEAERAQVALEKQKELLDKTSDELCKDSEVSIETVIDRFDEIRRTQQDIIEHLSHLDGA